MGNAYTIATTTSFDEVSGDGTIGNSHANEVITWSGNPNVPVLSLLAAGEDPCPPTTVAPTTVAPTTAAPTTAAPTTVAPTTVAPTTVAPTTAAPTTAAPTTVAPTTVAPTEAPTTEAPSTVAPTTAGPATTVAPTTAAPTTEAPTTAAPAPDSDSDGIPDAQELLLGTDPAHPDTDRDGHYDGYETAFGLDPLDNLDFPCSSFTTCETCAGATLPWALAAPLLTPTRCGWCAGIGCVAADGAIAEFYAGVCHQVGDNRFAFADNDTAVCGDPRPARTDSLSMPYSEDSSPIPTADAEGPEFNLTGTFCAPFYPTGGNVCSREVIETLGSALEGNAGVVADLFGPPGDCCYDAVSEMACRIFCEEGNMDWVGLSSAGTAIMIEWG